jgi:hypothetical protein
MVERAGDRRARPADAVGERDHRARLGHRPSERIGQAAMRIGNLGERRVRRVPVDRDRPLDRARDRPPDLARDRRA